jgi:hypothetical protein
MALTAQGKYFQGLVQAITAFDVIGNLPAMVNVLGQGIEAAPSGMSKQSAINTAAHVYYMTKMRGGRYLTEEMGRMGDVHPEAADLAKSLKKARASIYNQPAQTSQYFAVVEYFKQAGQFDPQDLGAQIKFLHQLFDGGDLKTTAVLLPASGLTPLVGPVLSRKEKRMLAVLEKNGYTSVSQLTYLTKQQIRKLKGMTPDLAREIITTLEAMGLPLDEKNKA